MSSRNDKQQTFIFEQWRAVSSGVIETANFTFLLLIAVRWFEAENWTKALVAGGGSVGLLAGPWIVHWVQASGMPVSRATTRLALIGASGFAVMAAIPTLPVFVAGAVISMATLGGIAPLITQIYQENYPKEERGSLFARALVIRIGVAALFSEIAGQALDGENIDRFRWLLAAFSLAFAFSAFCLSRNPSRPLKSAKGTHPFRSLRYAKDDKLFRHILICWMIFGVGNLMTLPLRVEFAANPEYGHALAISTVALLTGVIPNVVRLLFSPLWGWLFDRANFFVLRAVLNSLFAISIVVYFGSGSVIGLVAGSVLYGIAFSGGEVAWSLWVTKFAPPDRVADYMSVHTCFTGVRGLISPFLGFWLISFMPMWAVGTISGGLVFVSSFMLAGRIRDGEKARKAAPLLEEFPD